MSLNPRAIPAPTPALNDPCPESESIFDISVADIETAPVAVPSAPPVIAALTSLAIRLTEIDPPPAKSAAPEPAAVALPILADSPPITETALPVTPAPEIDALIVLATSLVETAAPTAPAEV